MFQYYSLVCVCVYACMRESVCACVFVGFNGGFFFILGCVFFFFLFFGFILLPHVIIDFSPGIVRFSSNNLRDSRRRSPNPTSRQSVGDEGIFTQRHFTASLSTWWLPRRLLHDQPGNLYTVRDRALSGQTLPYHRLIRKDLKLQLYYFNREI